MSFKAVYVPQCGQCSTAVIDTGGREMIVTSALLPSELRARLTADGWDVRPGDPKRGRHDPLMGDSLTCPACLARDAQARAAFHATLNGPRAATVDMTARIGPGWRLVQRPGDDERHTWLAEHDGTVHGLVRRYKRVIGATGFVRHSATDAASSSNRSSFLWRSRDLAAWGIATMPRFDAPNPSWATRPRKST